MSFTAQTLGLQTKLPFDTSKRIELATLELLDGRRLKVRGVIIDVARSHSAVVSREALQLPNKFSVKPNCCSINPIVAFWNYVSTAKASTAYNRYQRPLMAFARTLTGERYTVKHARFQSDRYAYCLRLLQLSQKETGQEDLYSLQNKAESGNIARFVDQAWYFCNRRVLVYTEGGRYGFAPQCTKSGDLCAVLFGCKVPFLLRPTGEGHSQYRLVGEAYIQGLMEGEVVDRLNGGELLGSDLILV